MFGVAPIQAQSENTIKITGNVVDLEDGQGLPGVNIIIQGTTFGTISDVQGNYVLEAPDNGTLVFSFVGYLSQEVAIAGRSTIDVQLEVDAAQLDEIVVVGYGTQKSSNLTSAVAKLSMEKIEDRPINRVEQALIGQMAGVRVQETTGMPGAALSVRVRGVGSISGSGAPLYVVDGIPISGDLNNIAVGDIESIEVLKDAASAAIYGSRGSDGVVIITTKSGSSGKPMVTFKSQFGVQEVFSTYDALNRDQWIDFALDERTNTYLLNGGDPSVPEDDRLRFSRINPLWRTNPESFPDTDWQDLIFRSALFSNHQLSVGGGTDKTKYYFYGEYMYQEGVVNNSDYERYSFKAKIEHQFNDRLKLGLNISPSFSVSNDPNSESLTGPVSRSKNVAPIVEKEQGTVEGGFNPYTASFFVNPYVATKEITDKRRNFRTISSIYLEYEIIEGLKYRSSFNSDINNFNSSFFITSNINRGRGHRGSAASGFTSNLLWENILTYDKSFGNHSIQGLAVYSSQKFRSESLSAIGTDFPDEEVRTLNAAGQTNATSFATENALISYVARANYSYKDRYLFTASIRRDGSSRFGENNRWGVFPSLSAGWRISEESFMSTVSLINNLKLRASYGQTGRNGLGDFSAIGGLVGENYILGNGLGSLQLGLRPNSISNPDLTWETTSTINVGVDLGLFENRITLGFDYYRSITSDLLLNVPVPTITGFSFALQNLGEVENKGFEVELGIRALTGEFKWSVNGNIAHNKNTVKKLGPEGAPIFGSARGFQIAKTEIGQPIGSYFLIPVEGIFQTQEEVDNSPVSKIQNPGDLKYSDTNGDGVINPDDRVHVGQAQPDFTWGMSHNFQYKNFDLGLLFIGEWGNNLINIQLKEDGQSRGNVYSYWLNRWKSPSEPGDGETPRAAVTSNLTTASTWWMRDASFFKLRNITLGYSLPPSVMEKIKGVSGFRAYLSVENVFSIDDYFGIPSTAAWSNTALAPGIDTDNSYPLPRTFTLGLNFTF